MSNFDFFTFIGSGYFTFFIIVYVVFTAGLGAWVADKKGYSPIAWFLMCLLTGIAGLVALAGVPVREKEIENEETLSGSWICKKCQTENLSGTASCRGCGAACE